MTAAPAANWPPVRHEQVLARHVTTLSTFRGDGHSVREDGRQYGRAFNRATAIDAARPGVTWSRHTGVKKTDVIAPSTVRSSAVFNSLSLLCAARAGGRTLRTIIPGRVLLETSPRICPTTVAPAQEVGDKFSGGDCRRGNVRGTRLKRRL